MHFEKKKKKVDWENPKFKKWYFLKNNLGKLLFII